MLTQIAAVAELEAGLISDRTRKALAQKQRFYGGLTDEQKDELRQRGKATQLGGNRGNLGAVAAKGRVAAVVARQVRAASRSRDLAPILAEIRSTGITSLGKIAAELNARGIRTARGGAWSAMQVSRILGGAPPEQAGTR